VIIEENSMMGYDEIVKGCELLGYRDKFRLAQLLIQIAREEEEIHNPQDRIGISKEESYKKTAASEKNSIEYVMERIGKLRPVKKKSLLNSIRAMYQFQGGISEQDQEAIVTELQKRKLLKIESDSRVIYL
jgi:hypothetical protein